MKWLLLLPTLLFAFEKEPWFNQLAEFHFIPSYTFSHYPSVSNSNRPYRSNNNILDLLLSVRFLPNWEAQAAINASATRNHPFFPESAALQVRYRFWDDISGDPLAITPGLRLRYTTSRTLKDVSTPYHAPFDLELNTSLGKEFDKVFQWATRIYSYLALGIGNRGMPFIKADGTFQAKFQDKHRLGAYLKSYFGLGSRRQIDISRFFGYGKYRHQSVDLGASYTYLFEIYGKLTFSYAYRVYASTYPRHTQTALLKYDLPFSIF